MKNQITDERAALATQDARLLEKVATRLRVVGWEIHARGGDGKAELDDVSELVPQVLKAMVNYLPNRLEEPSYKVPDMSRFKQKWENEPADIAGKGVSDG